MTYTYSFQPNGKWFVFEIETGRTLFRDIPNRRAAREMLAANKLLIK